MADDKDDNKLMANQDAVGYDSLDFSERRLVEYYRLSFLTGRYEPGDSILEEEYRRFELVQQLQLQRTASLGFFVVTVMYIMYYLFENGGFESVVTLGLLLVACALLLGARVGLSSKRYLKSETFLFVHEKIVSLHIILVYVVFVLIFASDELLATRVDLLFITCIWLVWVFFIGLPRWITLIIGLCGYLLFVSYIHLDDSLCSVLSTCDGTPVEGWDSTLATVFLFALIGGTSDVETRRRSEFVMRRRLHTLGVETIVEPGSLGAVLRRFLGMRGFCPGCFVWMNEPWRIPSDNIELLDRLGSGGTGEVFRGALHGATGKTDVTVKKLYSGPAPVVRPPASTDELRLMLQLRHPNVVPFVGVCVEDDKQLHLVYEHVVGGSLYAALHDKTRPIDYSRRLNVAVDAAKGLGYLHSYGVVHGNVNARNLMLEEDLTCKVGDYLVWRFQSEQERITTCLANSLWCAPEVLHGDALSLAADIYSFGVALWEIFTREDPYPANTGDPSSDDHNVVVGEVDLRPPIPAHFPEGLRQLLVDCWTADPAKRPTIQTVFDRLQALRDEPSVDDLIDRFFEEEGGGSARGTKVKRLSPRLRIDYEELKLLGRLGEGSFGAVYKAAWRGTHVAIKKMHHQQVSPEVIDPFCSELAMLMDIRHPNIVLMLGAVTEPPNISIVMELAHRGGLSDILCAPPLASGASLSSSAASRSVDLRPLPFALRLNMALDAARGMNYLHTASPPIVHGDLKPANLLVDRDWRVKVGDLGCSKFRTETSVAGSIGSTQWMAPEIIRKESFCEQADVYSFGIILWQLWTRKRPYDGHSELKVVMLVGVHNHRPPIPESCPSDFAALMSRCWHESPDMRPSFSTIIGALEGMLAREVSATPTVPSSSAQAAAAVAMASAAGNTGSVAPVPDPTPFTPRGILTSPSKNLLFTSWGSKREPLGSGGRGGTGRHFMDMLLSPSKKFDGPLALKDRERDELAGSFKARLSAMSPRPSHTESPPTAPAMPSSRPPHPASDANLASARSSTSDAGSDSVVAAMAAAALGSEQDHEASSPGCTFVTQAIEDCVRSPPVLHSSTVPPAADVASPSRNLGGSGTVASASPPLPSHNRPPTPQKPMSASASPLPSPSLPTTNGVQNSSSTSNHTGRSSFSSTPADPSRKPPTTPSRGSDHHPIEQGQLRPAFSSSLVPALDAGVSGAGGSAVPRPAVNQKESEVSIPTRTTTTMPSRSTDQEGPDSVQERLSPAGCTHPKDHTTAAHPTHSTTEDGPPKPSGDLDPKKAPAPLEVKARMFKPLVQPLSPQFKPASAPSVGGASDGPSDLSLASSVFGTSREQVGARPQTASTCATDSNSRLGEVASAHSSELELSRNDLRSPEPVSDFAPSASYNLSGEEGSGYQSVTLSAPSEGEGWWNKRETSNFGFTIGATRSKQKSRMRANKPHRKLRSSHVTNSAGSGVASRSAATSTLSAGGPPTVSPVKSSTSPDFMPTPPKIPSSLENTSLNFPGMTPALAVQHTSELACSSGRRTKSSSPDVASPAADSRAGRGSAAGSADHFASDDVPGGIGVDVGTETVSSSGRSLPTPVCGPVRHAALDSLVVDSSNLHADARALCSSSPEHPFGVDSTLSRTDEEDSFLESSADTVPSLPSQGDAEEHGVDRETDREQPSHPLLLSKCLVSHEADAEKLVSVSSKGTHTSRPEKAQPPQQYHRTSQPVPHPLAVSGGADAFSFELDSPMALSTPPDSALLS